MIFHDEPCKETATRRCPGSPYLCSPNNPDLALEEHLVRGLGRVFAVRHPPPPCPELYPNAPCDGIPYDGAWFLVTILFLALGLWSLIASLVATAAAFGNRK